MSDKIKIPRMKISYKEYFINTPKCDICDYPGITLDEIKKLNKQTQIDSIVLDYILYQCSKCKVNLHKNCAYETKNFPFVNIKDKSYIPTSWTCERCTEFISSKNNIKTEYEYQYDCQICLKKDEIVMKPHYYKNLDDNTWVHTWCFLWFKTEEGSLDK
jgi:hypothetical protein